MKRILLLVIVLIAAITSTSQAQMPYFVISKDNIPLQVLGTDIPVPYVGFETYVWVYPMENGIICADFKMVTPAWLINYRTEFNTVVVTEIDQGLPCDEDGTRICLSSCATDPIWLCKVTHLALSGGLLGDIRIMPRPSIGYLQAANCLEGNPFEHMYAFCWFGLNYIPACWFANETSTWGAIKSIYSE